MSSVLMLGEIILLSSLIFPLYTGIPLRRWYGLNDLSLLQLEAVEDVL